MDDKRKKSIEEMSFFAIYSKQRLDAAAEEYEYARGLHDDISKVLETYKDDSIDFSTARKFDFDVMINRMSDDRMPEKMKVLGQSLIEELKKQREDEYGES